METARRIGVQLREGTLVQAWPGHYPIGTYEGDYAAAQP
jgi:hypothetical protein